jgi:DNA-binding transcriptional MerR regulator
MATTTAPGRRWYGPRELRRLAIIRYWQEAGLMRLGDIGKILAGPEAPDGCPHYEKLIWVSPRIPDPGTGASEHPTDS